MARGDISDLKVDGIDRTDFPDFCDAYFCAGMVQWRGWGELIPLTETELGWLSEDWGEKLSEMAHACFIESTAVYEGFMDRVMSAREWAANS